MTRRANARGEWHCTHCDKWLPEAQFQVWTTKEGKRRQSSWCNGCLSEYHGRWMKTPKGRKYAKRANKENWQRIKANPRLLRKHRAQGRRWYRENKVAQ